MVDTDGIEVRLSDQEYTRLLTEAASFLQKLDECAFDEILSDKVAVSDAVVGMAVYYFTKELVPIPIEPVGLNKIKLSAEGSPKKRKKLLTLYLATCLLGYQTTGQFAGLSFGVTEKELYAANTIIETFYDLDNPHQPNETGGRVFYWPKRSLEEKLKAIVLHRGMDRLLTKKNDT